MSTLSRSMRAPIELAMDSALESMEGMLPNRLEVRKFVHNENLQRSGVLEFKWDIHTKYQDSQYVQNAIGQRLSQVQAQMGTACYEYHIGDNSHEFGGDHTIITVVIFWRLTPRDMENLGQYAFNDVCRETYYVASNRKRS